MLRVRIPDPESHLVGISCVTMSQLPALCEPGPALYSAVSIPTILAVGRSQFSNVCKILASTWHLGKPGEWALSSTSYRFPSLLGVGGKLVDTSLSFATLSRSLGLSLSTRVCSEGKGSLEGPSPREASRVLPSCGHSKYSLSEQGGHSHCECGCQRPLAACDHPGTWGSRTWSWAALCGEGPLTPWDK